jgi:putative membrane protein
MGYLAWTLANILLDIKRNRLQKWDIFLVPFVGSFIMTIWDLTIDPVNSTILKQWIWPNGGAYFGVPIINFVCWFLVVYVFYQLFALYISKITNKDKSPELQLPNAYFYQAVLMYFIVGLGPLLIALTGKNMQITNQVGVTWFAKDIYQSMALVAVFTMWFVSLLCALRLFRKSET